MGTCVNCGHRRWHPNPLHVECHETARLRPYARPKHLQRQSPSTNPQNQ